MYKVTLETGWPYVIDDDGNRFDEWKLCEIANKLDEAEEYIQRLESIIIANNLSSYLE